MSVASPEAPAAATRSVLLRESAGSIERAEVFEHHDYISVVIQVRNDRASEVEIKVEGNLLWVQSNRSWVDPHPINEHLALLPPDVGYPLPRSADLDRAEMRQTSSGTFVFIVPINPPEAEPSGASFEFVHPDKLPQFEVNRHVMGRLLNAQSASEVVEALDLSEYEIRALLQSEELDDEERAAAEELLHFASIRRVSTKALKYGVSPSSLTLPADSLAETV
jgi:hypothetical protein